MTVQNRFPLRVTGWTSITRVKRETSRPFRFIRRQMVSANTPKGSSAGLSDPTSLLQALAKLSPAIQRRASSAWTPTSRMEHAWITKSGMTVQGRAGVLGSIETTQVVRVMMKIEWIILMKEEYVSILPQSNAEQSHPRLTIHWQAKFMCAIQWLVEHVGTQIRQITNARITKSGLFALDYSSSMME